MRPIEVAVCALPVPGLDRGQSTANRMALIEGEERGERAGVDFRRDERALIRRAQAGSEDALERLFRHHWPRAHRAAYLVVHDPAAAEDIAQEAFLAAVRSLDRFDRRRPFGPWLHRIVVNRAIDWARARALRAEVATEGEPAAATRVMATAGGAKPYSDETLAALAALSPEHRAVVVLRYVLEFTPREIAAALGIPRGTVNSRLRRALDRLSGELEEMRT
ncbi:MAG TPA: RNA polymerase sigma factor [Solirubrobacterales bacterium]|jgi:RNA polymerase sigma-70 factor (ECF subfamily)|nr:RNA polymerase sigma factor [Solirubrobacterales bacterium]